MARVSVAGEPLLAWREKCWQSVPPRWRHRRPVAHRGGMAGDRCRRSFQFGPDSHIAMRGAPTVRPGVRVTGNYPAQSLGGRSGERRRDYRRGPRWATRLRSRFHYRSWVGNAVSTLRFRSAVTLSYRPQRGEDRFLRPLCDSDRGFDMVYAVGWRPVKSAGLSHLVRTGRSGPVGLL